MSRFYIAYALSAYLLFQLTCLGLVAFLGGMLPLGSAEPLPAAIAIDLLLLLAFGLQHSVMARPAFKRIWTRIVPEPIERSTYVLATCAVLLLTFVLWRPFGPTLWDVRTPALRSIVWAGFGAGWLLILSTTFLISHFDLFGVRQAWLAAQGRPYTPAPFATPGPYRLVRHPLYVGWITAFWSVPTLTASHALFAGGMTAYILIAIQLEERDLVSAFGSAYEDYRARVPMLVPRVSGARPAPVA